MVTRLCTFSVIVLRLQCAAGAVVLGSLVSAEVFRDILAHFDRLLGEVAVRDEDGLGRVVEETGVAELAEIVERVPLGPLQVRVVVFIEEVAEGEQHRVVDVAVEVPMRKP